MRLELTKHMLVGRTEPRPPLSDDSSVDQSFPPGQLLPPEQQSTDELPSDPPHSSQKTE